MAPEKPLTKKQRTILDAIIFLIHKGELPTVREVGALVGLRSPATVLKHLRVLEKASLISLSGKSRGIRIVDPVLLERVIQDTAGADPSGDLKDGDPLSKVIQTHLPEVARLASPSTCSREPSGTREPSGAREPSGFRPEDGSSERIRNLFALRRSPPTIPLVGAIAAGNPFESHSDGFMSDAYNLDNGCSPSETSSREFSSTPSSSTPTLGIDPKVFCDSGDVMALKVEGNSMVNAGILDGDYAIIRRQNTVEEGEIAAVIINGEGTLKRWHTGGSSKSRSSKRHSSGTTSLSRFTQGKSVCLKPENENFEPIEITEEEGKDVLVIGKYVGLVRGINPFVY